MCVSRVAESQDKVIMTNKVFSQELIQSVNNTKYSYDSNFLQDTLQKVVIFILYVHLHSRLLKVAQKDAPYASSQH